MPFSVVQKADCTALYYTTLHCTVLHYTTLQVLFYMRASCQMTWQETALYQVTNLIGA